MALDLAPPSQRPSALQIEGLVGHIAALERANLPRGADSARDLLGSLTHTLTVKRGRPEAMRERDELSIEVVGI